MNASIFPRSTGLPTALCAALLAIPGSIWADELSVLERMSPVFDDAADIGNTASAGSLKFDAGTQTYELAGSGANMWAEEDAFFFAYKKMSGDFILSANAAFVGAGVDPHRKIGWMVRESLDSDAAYVDIALHGDGLTSLQYRQQQGGPTGEAPTGIEAPSVLQLERQGDRFVAAVGRPGDRLARTEYDGAALPDEVYVGLFICAHNNDVVEHANFSNVRISIPAPPDFRPYQDYYRSRLEIMDVATGHRRIVHETDDSMQAPNWTRDGKALIFNRNGRLYRFELADGVVSEIDTGFAIRNNNDHALSFDGRQLAISHHAEDFNGESIIYTLPATGGEPRQITRRGPSYFHGWSPDGMWLTFTGGRDGNYDIYRIASDGESDEQRLTSHEALDDGSEYDPDGEWIWFNSARTGRMEIWRMRADGSDQQQVTDDEYNNWFPHVSPDGSQFVYLAYMPDVDADDHPWYRHVYLVLREVQGGAERVIANLYGGQGTINVPSWSPNGRYIAFVSN